MLSVIHSAGLMGIDAYPLNVEVDISMSGFPAWHTVGLPDSEVKESKERVVAAIKNSGYDFAQRKITINLAPADVKKEGTAFDLPIALGLMASSGMIEQDRLNSFLFLGELSLNGELRPVRGTLPVALMARKKKYKGVIVPDLNGGEAAVVQGLPVYGLKSLTETVEFMAGRISAVPVVRPENGNGNGTHHSVDFDEICGQHGAKRALEVAASGGHNIIFIGPPGSGKTMLASRLPTILPPLSFDESLETSRIYSVAESPGLKNLLTERPFRAPHHSVSDAGLIGGGAYPLPGEISLAHHGVLFLDELPEFKKNVLELLRQPLEGGEVTISRAAVRLTYPAHFMMVAAMNPCPCGYLGHPRLPCLCSPTQIRKYRTRISGPLLDRIDLQIEVPPLPFDEMMSGSVSRENSSVIRGRVLKVREFQQRRFEKDKINLNSEMGPKLVRKYCRLRDEGRQVMKNVVEKFHLSARAFDRILKVSRTIADMEASESIETNHVLEAVQYRSLDRVLY